MRVRATTAAAALIGSAIVVVGSPSIGAQTPTCFGEPATIVAEPGEKTVGTDGDDVIVGTSGPDVIRAGEGDDLICSRGGADDVSGGPGDDRMKLGKSGDTARGGSGRDTIYGNSGRDNIRGNSGRDILRGGSAGDTISGGSNDDDIVGGTGQDTLSGNKGADSIDGAGGFDICSGGSGPDDLTSCNEHLRPFGAGVHRVGSDIAPGRYRSIGERGCYWERLSGFSGELEDIIDNDFQGFTGPIIVDILPTDVAFNPDGECGTFRWYESPDSPSSRIRPGSYVVGSDIRPGIYSASAERGCYWERLRDFEGQVGSIIANDFVGSDGTVIVQIRSSDEGFYADDDCGTWTRD